MLRILRWVWSKKDAFSDDITVWYLIDSFKINDQYTTFAALKNYNASSTGGAHGMYGTGYTYFDKGWVLAHYGGCDGGDGGAGVAV